MSRETFTAVTSFTVNEMAYPVVYVKFTNASGETNRPLTVRAYENLVNLTYLESEGNEFDVEFIYYNDESTVVDDVVITTK